MHWLYLNIYSSIPCYIHGTASANVQLNTFLNRSQPLTISEALRQFRCEVQVDLQLPCTHVVKMECKDESDIADGKNPYPKYFYSITEFILECICGIVFLDYLSFRLLSKLVLKVAIAYTHGTNK